MPHSSIRGMSVNCLRSAIACCATMVALTASRSIVNAAPPEFAPLETLDGPGLPIGATVPELQATNAVNGKSVCLVDRSSKLTVVVFMSTRCPCTAQYLDRIERLETEFKGKVRFVGVNSNANERTEDASDYARSQRLGYSLLRDEKSAIARALRAKATPEVFVLDRSRTLRYHGAIDDSLDGRVHREYLRAALMALLAGRAPATPQTVATGCGIFVRKQSLAAGK